MWPKRELAFNSQGHKSPWQWLACSAFLCISVLQASSSLYWQVTRKRMTRATFVLSFVSNVWCKHPLASALELQSWDFLERAGMAIANSLKRCGLFHAIKPKHKNLACKPRKPRDYPRIWLYQQPLQHIINKQCHIRTTVTILRTHFLFDGRNSCSESWGNFKSGVVVTQREIASMLHVPCRFLEASNTWGTSPTELYRIDSYLSSHTYQ